MLNFKTSPDFNWFWFPVFGWGLGLVMGALNTFGISGNWEEKKINEIMEKNKKRKFK